MQKASEAYRAEMKEDLRNPSYVWVYLGVINQQAQSVAAVDAEQAEISDPSYVTESTSYFEGYYATMEQNLFRLDGEIFFQPETGPYALKQGVVTDKCLQPITFSFGDFWEISVKGLTIDFGDYYPTLFEVTNGKTTHTYAPKEPGKFVLEDVFSNCNYIKITPLQMVGGMQRFRIISILFGVGLQFSNRELINTSRTNSVAHISSELPQKQFTFTVDNQKLKLNKDNPDSYANYLEEKQECVFEYGRELQDGTIERIPGGRTLLKTWSSNDVQARFTTVGRLEYMVDTYYKGKYRPGGITAYDLAEEVLQDAGEEHYTIDEKLRSITLFNPLPVDTHKACLQLIANACRAILFEDRDGNITIKTSVLPPVATITSTGGELYSSVNNVLANNTKYDYATFEKDYFRVDGALYFLPEDGTYLPGGYVSGPTDEDGRFVARDYVTVDGTKLIFQNGFGNRVFGNKLILAPPSSVDGTKLVLPGKYYAGAEIIIKFSELATVNGLALQFGDVWPVSFDVVGYVRGEVVETYTITDTSKTTHASAYFDSIDELHIVFTKTKPFQRVHLEKISFAGEVDYEITYHDMKESPIATGIENVSNVLVHIYQYSKGDESGILLTTGVVVGNNTILFSDSAYDYSVEFANGNSGVLEIIEYGAHYIVVYSSMTADINVRGKRYMIADNIYKTLLHETGTEKELKNDLISNRALARNVAGWLGEYYDNDIEYDVTYRGEPTLDCDDVIYLENKYVEKNLIRIGSETLNTSTGLSLSCKVTGRRVNLVSRRSTLGFAVVGTAIVGIDVAN